MLTIKQFISLRSCKLNIVEWVGFDQQGYEYDDHGCIGIDHDGRYIVQYDAYTDPMLIDDLTLAEYVLYAAINISAGEIDTIQWDGFDAALNIIKQHLGLEHWSSLVEDSTLADH